MMLELLPAITLDDVNAAARRMFPADAARLVAYAGSTKSGPPPSAQQLLARLAGAGKAPVAQPGDMPPKPSVTEK